MMVAGLYIQRPRLRKNTKNIFNHDPLIHMKLKCRRSSNLHIMKADKIIALVFTGIGMAMGVAALVLNLLDPVTNASTSITLLGIAAFCFGVLLLDLVQNNGSEA